MGFIWVIDGGMLTYVNFSSLFFFFLSALLRFLGKNTIESKSMHANKPPKKNIYRALAIIILIGRSKLVLDFAVSLHIIHLAVVIFYTGQLPHNTAWWLTMAAASAVAVILGTWGCRYRELKPISFGGGASSSNNTTAGAGRVDGGPGDGGGADGDEEQGFTRGRGRGRGRDGAGEYEMVRMNENNLETAR